VPQEWCITEIRTLPRRSLRGSYFGNALVTPKERGRLKDQAQWHIKASNKVKLFGILQLIPLLDL